jgi:hypothetical protein
VSQVGLSTTTTVVGRQAERRLLDEAVRSAAAGDPCAVLVLGEAGVGKTTLVRSLAERAAAGGATVLWAPCLRFGAVESTLLPLVQAFERWQREVGPEAATSLLGRVRGAADLVPSLGEQSGTSPVGLLPVVGAVVDRIAAAAPTVLVLDDVQWADAATRDAVAYVVAGFSQQRLTVLCTLRDEGLSELDPVVGWLADLRRLPGVRELPLARLGQEDTERQLAGVLGRTPAPSLMADVFERSGGNPYLSELLVQDADPAAERLSPDPSEALSQALLRVWRGLSRDARTLTQVLAVAGRPVATTALLGVADEHLDSPSDAGAALTEAVDRGVVVRLQDRMWFRHPLLGDLVLRESFAPGEQRIWHEAWATTLEHARATTTGVEELRRLGDLALHREAAGDLSGAYLASEEAAALARDLCASREEATHLLRATRLWSHRPEQARHVDQAGMLERAARASSVVGWDERAGELLQRALSVVDE